MVLIILRLVEFDETHQEQESTISFLFLTTLSVSGLIYPPHNGKTKKLWRRNAFFFYFIYLT